MNTSYLISIDAGSQSAKVSIFDTQGHVVSSASERLSAMHLAEGGIVEHPNDDIWQAIISACQKAMQGFKGDHADIVGVGLCTIRFCRALLKVDGTLSQPVMSWMDTRVSKLYVHNNPATAYVTTSSGYITHRLTGQCVDAAANYQGVWPMDTDSWDWYDDPKILKEYSLSREMLFDLVMSGGKLGCVTQKAAESTSIPEGLPVFCTANDKATEALGAGLLKQPIGVISLGTYIAGMVSGQENPKNTTHFWTNFACMPHHYLYESHGIRRGMWTVNWYKDLIGPEFKAYSRTKQKKREVLLEKEAEAIPVGSDGLMTVLDWLAPTDKMYKKGIMIGFDAHHTRGHIYRSILEAIAMTMKNKMDAMTTELNQSIKQLIITGGGSNSDLFMQIFADVFGLPTQRNVINGSASVGSAICATVGLGIYESFEQAVEKMLQVDRVFQPNSQNHERYEAINQGVYQSITQFTDPVLEKAYPFFNTVTE
ncbi:MAG: FGGY-family carbohydrate kinase [Ostreibacterium sp.]